VLLVPDEVGIGHVSDMQLLPVAQSGMIASWAGHIGLPYMVDGRCKCMQLHVCYMLKPLLPDQHGVAWCMR
jgi:hypothetical protein